MKTSESEALAKHAVLVGSDSAFQRRLRLLQSLWRQDQDLPVGDHNGAPLGSSIAMPYAVDTLANFLTPAIRELVRAEVDGPKAEGKLYGKPRIYSNLLSSQPLCFNLFGELALDLELATRVMSRLWPEEVGEVTSIEFEWSPGRGDDNFLGNNSAFDVVVFHTTPDGEQGFVGIEVKYHENMRVGPAPPKFRYSEVARDSHAFIDPSAQALAKPPLQQIWLDHMLALAMLQRRPWRCGKFVVLYPSINTRCSTVVDRYSGYLADPSTFQPLEIEAVAEAIADETLDDWVSAFSRRYLDYERAEREISRP